MTIYGDYPCDVCKHDVMECIDCIFNGRTYFHCKNEKCRLHDGESCQYCLEDYCGAADMGDPDDG